MGGKLKSRLILHTALRVASRLKQFDDDGLVRPQLQHVQIHRPQTVHSRAGNKHSHFRQAQGPGRIQGVTRRPDVEQDEEVDTTPGAQEGQDRGRWRREERGVGGGIEGEKSEAAV